MASGRAHDKATARWCVPFGVVLGIFMDLQSGMIGTCAFLIGGFWLSPDLDTRSIALQKWNILRIVWWPYRKVIPHRSFFSHGPLIGTAIRILYLIGLIIISETILKELGIEFKTSILTIISEMINKYPKETKVILFAIEASAWTHLIKDRDPLPSEWKKWIRR